MTPPDDGAALAAPAPRPVRLRKAFGLCFVGVFLAVAAWSLATPLFASPDEPDQVIKAVAVVHGEFVGTPAANPTSARTFVHVPVSYMSGLHVPGCFVGRRNVTPSCAPPLSGDTESIRVSIYVGRYPPLYYAIVGLPSLFSSSGSAVRAMRLLSAVLTSVFLAFALSSAWVFGSGRIAVVGVLLAATPEVLFFGGVVNPSSLELSAAICFWTSVLLLARGGRRAPPRALVTIATTAGVVEVLCRSLSPLWVAITATAGVVLAGRDRLVVLARSRSIRIGALVIVAAAALATAWILGVDALHVQTVRGAGIAGSHLRALLDRQQMYLQQTVGEFGTEDIPAPLLTYAATLVGLVALTVVSLVRGRWPGLVALVALVATAFAVPFAIVLSQATSLHGFVWQGRDGAPLTLGVPIAAGILAAECDLAPRTVRALGGAVVLLLGIGQIVAFTATLDRYTAGAAHGFDFFGSTSWQPPLGARPVFLVFVLTLTVGSLLTASFVAELAASHPIDANGPPGDVLPGRT